MAVQAAAAAHFEPTAHVAATAVQAAAAADFEPSAHAAPMPLETVPYTASSHPARRNLELFECRDQVWNEITAARNASCSGHEEMLLEQISYGQRPAPKPPDEATIYEKVEQEKIPTVVSESLDSSNRKESSIFDMYRNRIITFTLEFFDDDEEQKIGLTTTEDLESCPKYRNFHSHQKKKCKMKRMFKQRIYFQQGRQMKQNKIYEQKKRSRKNTRKPRKKPRKFRKRTRRARKKRRHEKKPLNLKYYGKRCPSFPWDPGTLAATEKEDRYGNLKNDSLAPRR